MESLLVPNAFQFFSHACILLCFFAVFWFQNSCNTCKDLLWLLIGGRFFLNQSQFVMKVAAQRVADIIWVPMAGSSIEPVSSLWS
jgi:hypothetical protein